MRHSGENELLLFRRVMKGLPLRVRNVYINDNISTSTRYERHQLPCNGITVFDCLESRGTILDN